MEYILKRVSRSKSIKLSLNHQGQVVVSAPRFALKMIIDGFVKQNEPWIERQRQRLDLKKMANPTLDWKEEIISYLGKLYRIKFTDKQSDKVRFEAGMMWVKPVTLVETDIKKTLLAWLKIQAEKYILEKTKFYATQMKVEYGTVRFGQQVSRWGSCTGDNNLRFNWRLIHFPAEVIDYVVIHELAHTVHHDHSDRFWKLVAEYCTSWKDQRRFLKSQAITIEKM